MPYGATVADLEPGKPLYHVVVPKKLPLGKKVTGNKKPGLFRVYVPTRDGGELQLKTTAGTLEVYAPDGSPAKNAAGQAVPKAADVKFEVPDGVFGWYGIVVNDAASYELSSKFRIAGHACDKDGSMLVPWHFYYFPFTDVENPNTTHPSAKYDQKFPGSKANAWEKAPYWASEIKSNGAIRAGMDGHGINDASCKAYNDYCGKTVVVAKDCWWWGHCDAAASASTLFKKPSPSGGLGYLDLYWMVTEITMRGYDLQCEFHLGGLPGRRSAPSNKDIPGPEKGQAVDKDIGPFHDVLVKLVKKDKMAGLCDFRAFYEGKDQSADVWNQAVYKFEAEAWQAEDDKPGGDEEASARKLEFKNKVTANADASDAASQGGDPESDGKGWIRELEYVLNYDQSGKVLYDHPDNNYKKCAWGSKTAYAPRYLFRIKGLLSNGGGAGNPEVKLDKVQTLGMRLRPFYGG